METILGRPFYRDRLRKTVFLRPVYGDCLRGPFLFLHAHHAEGLVDPKVLAK
jgi:hypothetical protein